jgi:polyisoprenoid-binding protein YceI
MQSVNSPTVQNQNVQTQNQPQATPAPLSAGRFTLDAAHTNVGFSVRHMMISNVRGQFGKVSGEVSYDPARPEQTRLSVTVDVGSIDTREEKRDAHLRSADFFDAEAHPQMTFVSRQVRRKGEGLELVGDLTIRGTTREITLAVDDITPEHTDPWGGRRIGATARGKIRRSDFGMRWNAALEAGGVLVGDEVKLEIEAQLIRQSA